MCLSQKRTVTYTECQHLGLGVCKVVLESFDDGIKICRDLLVFEDIADFSLPIQLPLCLDIDIISKACLNELGIQGVEFWKLIFQSIIQCNELIALLLSLLVSLFTTILDQNEFGIFWKSLLALGHERLWLLMQLDQRDDRLDTVLLDGIVLERLVMHV